MAFPGLGSEGWREAQLGQQGFAPPLCHAMGRAVARVGDTSQVQASSSEGRLCGQFALNLFIAQFQDNSLPSQRAPFKIQNSPNSKKKQHLPIKESLENTEQCRKLFIIPAGSLEQLRYLSSAPWSPPRPPFYKDVTLYMFIINLLLT